MTTHRASTLGITFLLTFAICGDAAHLAAQDPLIGSIVKAPIVPDGTAAGAHPDFVINLNISPDPSVPGRLFSNGEKIQVTFPPEFLPSDQVTVADIFSSPTCAPGNLACTTGILVQGWPQSPILPSFPPTPLGEGTPQYHMSLDGHVLQYEFVRDITQAGPVPGPGIKSVHIILNDFSNPPAGSYEIGLKLVAVDGSVLDEDVGQVQILETIQPSINVTSVLSGAPGNPSTIYQSTTPGELVPLAYDFYLWDGEGNALTGVEIFDDAGALTLKTGDMPVGHVTVIAPTGGEDATVFTEQAFTDPIPAALSGIQTGRMQSFFRAGAVPGDYEVVFSMDGGNTVTMFAKVVPEPSSLSLVCIAATAALLRRRVKVGNGSHNMVACE